MTDSSDLPFGWGSRNNQMSEHDMKLGGIAATKFAAKNSYDGDTTSSYKSNDQVRDFYLRQERDQNPSDTAAGRQPQQLLGGATSTEENTSSSSSSLPAFWENRQKERDLQAKQMNVFSRQQQQQYVPHEVQTRITGKNKKNEGIQEQIKRPQEKIKECP